VCLKEESVGAGQQSAKAGRAMIKTKKSDAGEGLKPVQASGNFACLGFLHHESGQIVGAVLHSAQGQGNRRPKGNCLDLYSMIGTKRAHFFSRVLLSR
jgi:hypothetical protein